MTHMHLQIPLLMETTVSGQFCLQLIAILMHLVQDLMPHPKTKFVTVYLVIYPPNDNFDYSYPLIKKPQTQYSSYSMSFLMLIQILTLLCYSRNIVFKTTYRLVLGT